MLHFGTLKDIEMLLENDAHQDVYSKRRSYNLISMLMKTHKMKELMNKSSNIYAVMLMKTHKIRST